VFDAGRETSNGMIVDTFVIPNIHRDIFPAISGTTQVQMLEALGIVESFSVASLIEAAECRRQDSTRSIDRNSFGQWRLAAKRSLQ